MHFVVKNDKEVEFKNLISDFVIPNDIQNDIIYCQKSLRTYLKVHQIMLTRYGEKLSTLPKIRKIKADLEREIYEINAEQKYLLIRLRRCLDEFYKTIAANNIEIDREYGCLYVNQIFKNSLDGILYDSEPNSVKKRYTLSYWFGKLDLDIEKELDKKKQNEKIEKEKLGDKLMQQSKKQISTNVKKPTQQTQDNQSNSMTLPYGYNVPAGLTLKQVSLLKPRSDRNDNVQEIQNNQKSNESNEHNNSIELNDSSKKDNSKESPKVAISINNGRMNLLQALKKARNQNQNSTTTSSTLQKNSLPSKKIEIPLVIAASQIKKAQQKLVQQQNKPIQSQTQSQRTLNQRPSSSKQTTSNDNSAQPSASSDDSQDAINNFLTVEKELIEPIEYSQEMFLSLFGLNTIANSIYLQQRRSKRRRRNVQSNERKDFHYGNLDITENLNSQKEKKKKIFLASPTANRNLKRKQIEKSYANKRTRESDRSSSSSPDQKIVCNQCSKNGDAGLSNCEFCRGYFHARCHQGAFLRKPLYIRVQICPSCQRKQKSRSASSDDRTSNSNEVFKKLPYHQANRESNISLLEELQNSVLEKKLITENKKIKSLYKEIEKFNLNLNKTFSNVLKKKEISEDDDDNIDENQLHENIVNKLKCEETLLDDCHSSSKSSTIALENLKNYEEEQYKFDEMMMSKAENVYEIYDSDDSVDSDDVVMVINESNDADNIYEINENTDDSNFEIDNK